MTGNVSTLLLAIRAQVRRLLLNITLKTRNFPDMTYTRIFGAALAVALLAGGAQAACYADYKAKRDNPLRLHYGVVELSGACSKKAAKQEIADRISRDGWTLLNVLGVFDDAGLQERRASAGQFFLRY